jgi:hypothetical protein
MGNIERQFGGWRIAEAIECCADPDLLSACIAADRDWKGAGSPSHFSFLSEYLNGEEAFRQNQSQTRLRQIYHARMQSDAQLKSSLIEQLLAGRIVAWGCRETPTAPSMAIPGPAWRYIHISSVRKCIAMEKTRDKTEIFNLRIFPIVDSPNVIDRLHDKTLVEALQMCLVDDPQLGAARKRAIAGGGTPASFGNEWHPYRAVWPVVQRSDTEPAFESAEKSDESTAFNLVKAANRIQGQRFAKLIGYLSAGRVVADGIPALGGMSAPVPRAIWQQDGIYIDLENGGLLEVPSRAKDRLSCPLKPLFTGLVLRKADSIHRISEIPVPDLRPVATRKVSKSKKNIVSKMASEKACCGWLIVFMRKSPDERSEIQDYYWRKAQVKWPKSLSQRGFFRAWAKAIEEAPAPEWSAGGAPKKSLRAKSPHQ